MRSISYSGQMFAEALGDLLYFDGLRDEVGKYRQGFNGSAWNQMAGNLYGWISSLMSSIDSPKPTCRCQSCGFRFRVDQKYLGRNAKCPNPECGTTVLLQAEVPAAPARPVAPSKSSVAAESADVARRATVNPKKAESTVRQVAERRVSATESTPTARRTSSHRNSRTTGSQTRSRYEGKTQSSVSPLVLGLIGTMVVGGIGIGAYVWSNSTAGSVVAQSSETQAPSADQIATSSREQTDVSNAPPAAISSGPVTAAVASPAGNPPSNQTPSAIVAGSGGNEAAQKAAMNQLGSAQLTSTQSSAAIQQGAQRKKTLEEKLLPFLKTHCADCHNADTQEGGVSVHQLTSIDQLLKDRKKWERVYRMINAGAMPPSDYSAKPDESHRKEMAEFLYSELFNFDCSLVNHAGRATLHRLNRAEYNNTIRDLFGLNITPADKFPQDDVGEGFDNIGDVLSVPPLLMEKYLDAAEEVAGQVIDTRDFSKGETKRIEAAQFEGMPKKPDVDGEGFAVLASTGAVMVNFEVPVDGTYEIRVEAAQTQAGSEDAKMPLGIDGQEVREFRVKAKRREPVWYDEKVKLKAGKHQVAAAFTNDFYDEKAPERRRDRNLFIRTIEVIGPEGGLEPQYHDTHRKFVTARPGGSISVPAAASAVLRPILYRAFRRPVTDAEVNRFASLVDRTVSEHKETYDYGLFVALQAILVSPDFLYRKEADPEGGATERALNEYEVASRLSYFLWSSMPDEELFKQAESKKLLDRTVLRAQIERMLKDPKAESLAQNFATQWLNLRNLADVRPNPDVFKDFDDSLRTAMSKETVLLFNTIVKEDRSIEEFLSADFTFVNGRLAKHYGIEGVNGDEFVRVSLQGSQRSGVLTHASILTLTSNPGRTSPVKRGKWILENILGEAPPPAPPGVPALEESTKDVSGLSLRERLELHRKDAGCASCHKAMDPLGMGFENFDAIGRWREQDEGKPVDASGDLPSGQSFVGPQQLISILRERKEQFSRTFAERLMVYGLGRGLEYYDKCAVDQVVKTMKDRGNTFSALVEGIVTSDPFLKRSSTREFEIPPKP